MRPGLLDEVRNLKAQGYGATLPTLRTIGYQEAFAHLDGEITDSEMLRLIKRNTRRYAKRQLTWFRRYDEQHWIDIDAPNMTRLGRWGDAFSGGTIARMPLLGQRTRPTRDPSDFRGELRPDTSPLEPANQVSKPEFPHLEGSFPDDSLAHLGLPFRALRKDDWNLTEGEPLAPDAEFHLYQK